jgi:cytochrome c oxidase cbb3-type subunit 3
MRSRCRDGAVALAAAAALVASCEREARRFRSPEPPPAAARTTDLVPGAPGGEPVADNPYGANAYAIGQGKTLFEWYNCVGCHANGGGGMGPPLMDARWIYGSRPDQIFAAIAQGRPNGMPAFGGRVPDDQIWQLVAYVQSMSGHVRKDAAPGRADAMHTHEPELLREEEPVVRHPGATP